MHYRCAIWQLIVVKTPGRPTAPNLHVYEDARLRIVYSSAQPHGLDIFKHSDSDLKVLSVIWNDGGAAVVVSHRGGSWEDSLRRVVATNKSDHAFLAISATRMVKKLRLLKGGSVPTFLVLGRCCATSLPWTLEEGRRGSQAILDTAG